MEYTLLTLKEMKKISQELTDLYQRRERKDRVLLLQAAATLPNMNAQAMLGAYLTVIQEVRFKEYHGKSPLKKNYFGGSSLCTIIANKLSINEVLNDDENLIYLFKFYECIEQLPDEKIRSTFKKEKKDMLAELIFLMQKIRKKENKRVNLIAQGVPQLESLQKKIKKILPQYELATATRFFCNTKRVYLLDFMDLVNETIDLYRQKNVSQPKNEKNKDEAYFYEYNTRMGLMLFVLLRIAHEYKCLSPTRSELFNRCLVAMNVKNIQDIPFENKEIWLNALSAHLSNIKNNPSLYGQALKNWEKRGVKLNDISYKLHEYIHEEEKNHRLSKGAQYVTQATSAVAQYGTGFAVTQIGRNYILAAIGGITGPVGVVIYSAAGTILMTQLGRLVTENLMPSAVSYVYAKVLEKIGNTIANGTTRALQYSFSVGRKGINNLLGQPMMKEDRAFLIEWINTLLKLPDEVVSYEEKEQIKYALGTENELTLSFVAETALEERNNIKIVNA